MRKIGVFLIFFINLLSGQEKILTKSIFNLDFEQYASNQQLPVDWINWGSFSTSKDSVNISSGNYAIMMISNGDENSFGSIAYVIPNQYKGKEIKLEGYIKTKNVEDGFAGLLLRLDKNNQSIGFENMQSQNLNGTNDWKKYSVTLPFRNDADLIYVAPFFMGKGTAWFDDFTLSIDGKSINSIAQIEVAGAELDHEFDTGSQFKIENISGQLTANLFELGKTWGYLKYHNSQIASGNFNWDYELFRIISIVKRADFQAKLKKWTASYGELEVEKLAKHYYIDFALGVGNPIFKNEKTYKQMNWDDDGYRLLSLFRYWNMIANFYPNKHLIDKKWEDVLKEYIPKFIEADNELTYKLTLLQLIGEVQDTHANIWQRDEKLDSFFGKNIVPVKLQFVQNKVIVTKVLDSFMSSSKIKTGDEIIIIDKVSVEEVVKEKIKFTPASNYTTKLRDASKILLRTNDTVLQIVYRNNSGIHAEKIKTVDKSKVVFWESQGTSHKTFDSDIGYINPAYLKRGEIDTIMNNFKDKKGIVIDLRGYPSDFIVFSLGDYLMPEPTDFVRFTIADKENIGKFNFTESVKVGKENPDYYKGKIAILVNETTQSQAEYTAMALRVAPFAKVFGSQTAGADGNVSEIYLPGNVRTMISGIGVYYPDKQETQRVGIVPDIEVKPTIKGIREGRDEVLERALKYIEEN